MEQSLAVSYTERRLSKIFATMLRIGCIGFGGGNALVPVIERETVNKGLITKAEYDELVVSANLTPGALPVELASGIGSIIGGMRGMVLGAAAMALPGAILTVLTLTLLNSVKDTALEVINLISLGVGVFIVYLLAGYAKNTLSRAKLESRKYFYLTLSIILAVFSLSSLKNIYYFLGMGKPAFSLSVIEILGISFGLLAAVSLYKSGLSMKNTHSKLKEIKTLLPRLFHITAVWLAVGFLFALPAMILLPSSLEFMWRGVLSSLISFGGGDAYLTIADGLFVESGLIDSDAFFSQLITVVNILPGSILCKTLTGVGFIYGANFGELAAIFTALTGFAISVSASGLVFGAALELLKTFRELVIFKTISRYIRPIIAGLLLNVALSLIKSMTIASAMLIASI